MARLIDANALCENIKKQYCESCKAQGKDYREIVCRACDIDDIRIDIEDAPTVDAVTYTTEGGLTMTKAKRLAMLQVAYDQVQKIHHDLCICGKTKEAAQTFEIQRKLILLALELQKDK